MNVEVAFLEKLKRYWSQAGVLYVISCTSWPQNVLKVGKTTSPKIRMSTYNSCNPFPVTVMGSWLMKNVNIAEKMMLAELAPFALKIPDREKPRQEFFVVPWEHVSETFNRRFIKCDEKMGHSVWAPRYDPVCDVDRWTDLEAMSWAQEACLKDTPADFVPTGRWLIVSPEQRMKWKERTCLWRKHIKQRIRKGKSLPPALSADTVIPKGICYVRALHGWKVQKQSGYSRIKPQLFVFGKGASVERIMSELDKAKSFLLDIQQNTECWVEPKILLPEDIKLPKGLTWAPYENAFRIQLSSKGSPLSTKIRLSEFEGDVYKAYQHALQVHDQYIKQLHPSLRREEEKTSLSIQAVRHEQREGVDIDQYTNRNEIQAIVHEFGASAHEFNSGSLALYDPQPVF